MPDPTKVPNQEFLEEFKGYVDDIPEGLAAAFALKEGDPPFAVVFGSAAWADLVQEVNSLEERLAAANETIEISQDQDTLDAIAESLSSLSDEDLASTYVDHLAATGTGEWTKQLTPGVKNFMDGPTYETFSESNSQPFRQIGEGEYRDMQRRIKNQRIDNRIMTDKYAEISKELDDLKIRFDLLEHSHTYFAGQAEFYRHEYDKLVGAVNAVRAINIEAL